MGDVQFANRIIYWDDTASMLIPGDPQPEQWSCFGRWKSDELDDFQPVHIGQGGEGRVRLGLVPEGG